jgi:hypothetical protein
VSPARGRQNDTLSSKMPKLHAQRTGVRVGPE